MASDETWPRPCLVDDKRRALCWGLAQWSRSHGPTTDGFIPSGVSAFPVLVVEYEDGGFASMPLDRVTMLDSGKLFDSYCWEAGNE